MDDLKKELEAAMRTILESLEREALGLESSTSGSSVPTLTLADLEKATDAAFPALYYQTSKHLNKLDKEGKPVAYHMKKEDC